MAERLEKPDYTQYVKPAETQDGDAMTNEIDCKKEGLCTASCLEELKSCSGYEQSIIIHAGGCCYFAARSGKCLRPEAEYKR